MKSRLPTGHSYAGRLARPTLLLLALAAICVIGWATPVRAQGAAMCPPGQDCPCAWSGWVNRDMPTATGDWEDLTSLVKEGKLKCRRPLAVQCRYRPGGPLWGYQVASYNILTPPAGYTCISMGGSAGGICQNAKTKPPGSASKPSCKDSEVRFCCLPE